MTTSLLQRLRAPLYEVALTVNMAALTIEEVVAKRKKMLKDMVPGLVAELRQQTEAEGLATPECLVFLLDRLDATRS